MESLPSAGRCPWYCMRPRTQSEESWISTEALPKLVCPTVPKCNRSITLRQLLRHFYIVCIWFLLQYVPVILFWHLCAPWVGLPAVETHYPLLWGNPKLLRPLSILKRAASGTEVLLLLYEFNLWVIYVSHAWHFCPLQSTQAWNPTFSYVSFFRGKKAFHGWYFGEWYIMLKLCFERWGHTHCPCGNSLNWSLHIRAFESFCLIITRDFPSTQDHDSRSVPTRYPLFLPAPRASCLMSLSSLTPCV